MKKELLLNTEVKAAFDPVASDGTAITGTIFDTGDAEFLSAIAHLAVGAVTGTPTDLDVVMTVYSGDVVDDEAAPTSITDEVASTVYVLTLADVQAGSAEGFMDIDLTGLGRYVRFNTDATFTGGTTPTAVLAGTVAFGDPGYAENVTAADV